MDHDVLGAGRLLLVGHTDPAEQHAVRAARQALREQQGVGKRQLETVADRSRKVMRPQRRGRVQHGLQVERHRVVADGQHVFVMHVHRTQGAEHRAQHTHPAVEDGDLVGVRGRRGVYLLLPAVHAAVQGGRGAHRHIDLESTTDDSQRRAGELLRTQAARFVDHSRTVRQPNRSDRAAVLVGVRSEMIDAREGKPGWAKPLCRNLFAVDLPTLRDLRDVVAEGVDDPVQQRAQSWVTLEPFHDRVRTELLQVAIDSDARGGVHRVAPLVTGTVELHHVHPRDQQLQPLREAVDHGVDQQARVDATDVVLAFLDACAVVVHHGAGHLIHGTTPSAPTRTGARTHPPDGTAARGCRTPRPARWRAPGSGRQPGRSTNGGR